MRLYLIKNVSRDPKFAVKRRANPLHVTKSPIIAGHRLFPRVEIKVSDEQLSDKEKASIEKYIKAGVVTLSELNGPQNLKAFPRLEAPVEEVVVVEEPEIDTVEAVEEVQEEVVEEPSVEEVQEEEIVEPEPAPEVAIEELVEDEESEENKYSEDELNKMKNAELREILSLIDPDFASGGVKKSDLVAAIMEKQ